MVTANHKRGGGIGALARGWRRHVARRPFHKLEPPVIPQGAGGGGLEGDCPSGHFSW